MVTKNHKKYERGPIHKKSLFKQNYYQFFKLFIFEEIYSEVCFQRIGNVVWLFYLFDQGSLEHEDDAFFSRDS